MIMGIHNKYFDIYLENPLKTYNKIKKYFRRIKPQFYFKVSKSPFAAKILEINSCDVLWKDKWNSPRHEYNPKINISLFTYIHLNVTFTLKDDSISDVAYWEAALYWLYYGKNLHRAIKNATGWTQYNEQTKKYEPIPLQVLKEPFQTMYNNHNLPIIKYENTTR